MTENKITNVSHKNFEISSVEISRLLKKDKKSKSLMEVTT